MSPQPGSAEIKHPQTNDDNLGPQGPSINTRAFITSLLASISRPEPHSTSGVADLQSRLKSDSETQNALLTLHVLFPNELLPALDLLDRNLVSRFQVARVSTGTAPDPFLTSPQPVVPSQPPEAVKEKSGIPIHYVRSSQPTNKKPRHRDRRDGYQHHQQQQQQADQTSAMLTQHYQVRLQAWSCSCPAFTFAAFPAGAAARRHRSMDTDPARVVRTRVSGFKPRGAEDGMEVDDFENVGLRGGDTPSGLPAVDLNDLFGSKEDVVSKAGMVGGLAEERDVPMCKHLLACTIAEYAAGGGLCETLVETRHVSEEELAGWAAGWGG